MARPYRAVIAESLGLDADATDDALVKAFRRSLHPADSQDDDKTAHAHEDPREAMTTLALSEQDKAEAAGRPITFIEGLTRARKANPALDQTLAEGYRVGRWTR